MAFWNFLMAFWKSGKNILYASIIKNPLFIRGAERGGDADTGLLDENVIGIRNFVNKEHIWLSLLCSDFINGEGIKSYDDLVRDLDVTLTPIAYMRIRRSITFAMRKYKINTRLESAKNLVALLKSKNKKSSIFRVWLTRAASTGSTGTNSIQKLCEITSCRVPDPEAIKKNLAYWCTNFLPLHIKEFSLKLSRNSLPVNARLAARYRTAADVLVDEGCRLCKKSNNFGPIPRETFVHLFYECPITAGTLSKFRNRYFQRWTDDEFKNAIFTGTDRDGEYCLVLKTLMTTVLYEIWKSRMSVRTIPSLSTVELNVVSCFESMFMCSRPFKKQAIKTDLFFFRKWWPADRNRRG
jgi:hypothetical protein